MLESTMTEAVISVILLIGYLYLGLTFVFVRPSNLRPNPELSLFQQKYNALGIQQKAVFFISALSFVSDATGLYLFFVDSDKNRMNLQPKPFILASCVMAFGTVMIWIWGIDGKGADSSDSFERLHESEEDLERGEIYTLQFPSEDYQMSIHDEQAMKAGPASWHFENNSSQQQLELSVETDGGLHRLSFSSPFSKQKSQAQSCCVLSNFPLPPTQTQVYFEVTIAHVAKRRTVAVGLATKPYPPFRLPGSHRHSVAVHCSDGTLYVHDGSEVHQIPLLDEAPLRSGDTIGIYYNRSSGELQVTHSGRVVSISDFDVKLSGRSWYPCIGVDGEAEVTVNFGLLPFVCREFNEKIYGLGNSMLGSNVMAAGVSTSPRSVRVSPAPSSSIALSPLNSTSVAPSYVKFANML
eukprot:TRINITY_DN240_c0_g1_i3.p1 TRINITY_DN240_c0_g1~~TRINITY_DN240_c0_g1_i3.p1  ORF type:complete len:409 (+),score=103.60 TRINITY_DN240_c0_g1_i3:77-1303(+)